MDMKTTRYSACVLLTVAALFLASESAAKNLTGMPLVWKPTDNKDGGVVNLSGLSGVKIAIAAFSDARGDRTKVGENQEDKTPKPVTTSSDVADFCRQNFASTLKQYGLAIVTEGADVSVSAEVMEFMVIETNTYKGDVRLKVSVMKGDRELWVGVVSGSSSRFGRSYKADNYNETLSDSLLQAATNTARDEGFRAALLAR